MDMFVLQTCHHLWLHPWMIEQNRNDSFLFRNLDFWHWNSVTKVCKKVNCSSVQRVGNTPVSSVTLGRVRTCRCPTENVLSYEKQVNILLQSIGKHLAWWIRAPHMRSSRKKERKLCFVSQYSQSDVSFLLSAYKAHTSHFRAEILTRIFHRKNRKECLSIEIPKSPL